MVVFLLFHLFFLHPCSSLLFSTELFSGYTSDLFSGNAAASFTSPHLLFVFLDQLHHREYSRSDSRQTQIKHQQKREKKLLQKFFHSSRKTSKDSSKLWKATQLQFVSLTRHFMSSFLQKRKTSRNWLTLRVKQLNRLRLSSLLFMSSTR